MEIPIPLLIYIPIVVLYKYRKGTTERNPEMYNCQLDNLAKSNVVCAEKTDGFVRFMNTKEFAETQAGIAWRAYVNESITVDSEHYDYAIGCNIFDFVDYGNGEWAYLATKAPAYRGFSNIPYMLNRELGKHNRGENSVLGNREVAILECVTSMSYDLKDEVFTVYSEEGSFQFTAKDGCMKITN